MKNHRLYVNPMYRAAIEQKHESLDQLVIENVTVCWLSVAMLGSRARPAHVNPQSRVIEARCLLALAAIYEGGSSTDELHWQRDAPDRARLFLPFNDRGAAGLVIVIAPG